MKRNYYLAMMSSFLIVLIFDNIFFLCSNQWTLNLAGSVLTVEILIYIIVNFLGCSYLYRPIKNYLEHRIPFEIAQKRIDNLALYSSLWLAFLGCCYTIIVMISLFYQGYFGHGLFMICFCFVTVLFSYFGFVGITSFFLVSRVVMDLKADLYRTTGNNFLPQHLKIGQKLIIIPIFLVLSFLFILIDLQQSGVFSDLEGHGMILLDMIFAPLIIFIVIFLITSELKKSFALVVKSFEEIRKGNLGYQTPVISNDEFGILARDFNNMVVGLQERELIRDAFGKYVTQGVADQIIKQKIDLAGEVRLVTIFFTDIENYTSISEKMSPKEVVELLNEYFSFIVEIVTLHQGIVNKFIGDSVFAIFNAPIDDPYHARHAIEAAKQIVTESAERTFKNIKINTRIGINTGVIVLGNIGSRDRLEYTAIGDEVNIAARLEQLNKSYATNILVGEKTYALTSNDFTFKQIGNIELKGKREAVMVYNV